MHGLSRSTLLGAALAVSWLGQALSTSMAQAQKQGGTLRIYNTTQPPSASPHEESTVATNMPFMAVFNSLVRYDPMKPRNSFGEEYPAPCRTPSTLRSTASRSR